MACCHQHNHQPSPNSCSHHCSPPAPPLDPLLLQSIVSLLLHHYPTPSAASFPGSARSPLDHQSCCSDHSEHHNRKGSPSPHQPSEHLSQAKCSAHSSLLQRMDLLESSFQRFSSAPSPDTPLSIRNLAARRIQARFRTFLVRRSRAFRRLKELTSVNSALDKIKLLDSSSASPTKIIQDGDKTTVDSKWLISRAFAEFLEQVEGICVRGNGVISKTIKDIIPVGIDEISQVSCASKESEVVGHDEKDSEHCNLDNNGKRMIYNLRERLRRIYEISEDVEDKDESRDCTGAEEHNRLQSNPENRVQFIEDENATKVHNSDGTELTSIVSYDVEKIEDTVERQQDGVEVESDGEKNPAESAEGSEDEVETENEDEVETETENEDEGSEDEYETENEGSEDEYETENEVSEDESGGCRGAEKHNRLQSNAEKHVRFIEDTNTRVYNSDGNFTEPTGNAKRIEETVEKQHNDQEVEGDDEKNPAESFEGSEDEAETENENENCEHEYETENEGSEDDYETENEVCEDEDDDETENEGSECEDETEYEEDEDCSHEGETEEDEGSEIVDDIPQNNKDNGIAVQPVETPLTYQELLVQAQLMRQHISGEKNAEMTHDGQGSGNHRRHLRNVLCHVCFKRGHMRRECWYNPSRLCKKCHTIGHAQEVCAIVNNWRRQQAQVVN